MASRTRCSLADRLLGIGDVVEDGARRDAIERGVAERKLAHVGPNRLHAGPLGELHHPRRGIDGDDLSVERGSRPGAQVAEPRADVEQAPGPCDQDPGAHDLLFVGPLEQLGERERALPECLFRGVLLSDRIRVVEPVRHVDASIAPSQETRG